MQAQSFAPKNNTTPSYLLPFFHLTHKADFPMLHPWKRDILSSKTNQWNRRPEGSRKNNFTLFERALRVAGMIEGCRASGLFDQGGKTNGRIIWLGRDYLKC